MESSCSKIFWESLPAEIRILILNSSLHAASAGRKLSRLAVVSREWQTVVERQNFARLRLTPSRLAEFPSRIHRNRHLVRYIWFCLELEKYDCSSKTESTFMLSHTNGSILASGFQALFSTLSTWNSDSGIQLDIGVYSPSDLEHWMQYSHLKPDFPLDECLQGQGMSQVQLPNADHCGEDWNIGSEDCACRLPSTMSKSFGMIRNKKSLFDGEEQEARWWQGLPLVPAVTSILLRQQTRRQWNPITLGHIFSRLPRLQEIYYEPWRDTDPDAAMFSDEGEHLRLTLSSLLEFQYFFESIVSKDVQKLVMFGNFHQTDLDAVSGSDHGRTLTHAISQMAAETSLKLKHFSGAFLVEADQFFSSRESSWEWNNLQSLVLTSQLIAPESELSDIEQMLKDAAAAAMRMPRLDTLEIWNGREALASLFKYQSSGSQTNATLTWRSTWELSIPSSVIQAWRAVAQKHGARGFTVSTELLDIREKLESHGDAVRYLRLSTPVLRPVSLQQICTDHNIHKTWEERREDWRATFLHFITYQFITLIWAEYHVMKSFTPTEKDRRRLAPTRASRRLALAVANHALALAANRNWDAAVALHQGGSLAKWRRAFAAEVAAAAAAAIERGFGLF
ncbi:hypothetical protein diail_10867 [Diaporthe ilicicola]|nr:hypothetical protein diail_10867 [Diaporthe ilicicola]